MSELEAKIAELEAHILAVERLLRLTMFCTIGNSHSREESYELYFTSAKSVLARTQGHPHQNVMKQVLEEALNEVAQVLRLPQPELS